ncbi:hypothetical protein KIL84_005054 [Mauremys mutica]|uniref:Uncharacterized protein n=1 Tax=Mauremys mutica TaxID=74926 RepID=A0A9D3XL68_9SAUR|nr:hypothetical protein KIL84_005054 [Mauremys mutica]
MSDVFFTKRLNLDKLYTYPDPIVLCAFKPDAVHSFVGFDAVPALEQEIVKLEKDVSFKEVEEEDVQELLVCHTEQLTNEELIELDEQWISEESKDDDDDDIGQEARSLMTKNLSHFFGLLDEMTEIIQSSDPFHDRSAKVSRALNDAVACYREIYHSKIPAAEQTLIKSFYRTSATKKPAQENPYLS